MSKPKPDWVTIAEAVELAGCTGAYLRRLLSEGDKRLTGWKAGARAWMVKREDVIALRASLTTRSNLRKDQRTAATKQQRKRKTP